MGCYTTLRDVWHRVAQEVIQIGLETGSNTPEDNR